MSRFVIAPRARSDLDGIWSYIAADSALAADRMLDRFHKLFKMLSRQPLIGEARDDIRPGVRSFPAGNYVIYYRPVEGAVQVFRIIHGARELYGPL